MDSQNDTHQAWSTLSGFCFAFAVVFLLTALVLDWSGNRIMTQSVPAEGGLLGPLEIDDAMTVLELTVRHRPQNNNWSFVAVELLDKDQNYLTGFGDELWHASGYSGGSWTETKYSYSTKITVREKGEYYLRLSPEASTRLDQMPDIWVQVEELAGSAIPHLVGGVILLIISIFMNIKSGGVLCRVFSEA